MGLLVTPGKLQRIQSGRAAMSFDLTIDTDDCGRRLLNP
jgi:hypothetical protein